MQINKLYVLIIAIAIFVGWSAYDSSNYFSLLGIEEAQAVTDTVTLNASVATGAVTLTLGSGSTVNFGTITPGTPRYAESGFSVNGNDTINVSLGRDRATAAHALASNANPSSIYIDDDDDMRVFTGCGSPVTATWVSGSSTGLGFSIHEAAENKDTACWGTGTSKTDASNQYAALQASSAASTAWTTTSTSSTIWASVGWVLDVPGTQQATSYTGDVIVTATATP